MARAAERFLIFALPRSGSTSLAHALNCHPDIRCCLEPFNTTRTDIPVPARVEDRETLEERLARIREEYNGIKHVYVPAGWPFPEGSTLNGYLLRRPGHRVILLHRRNLLQQIVSNEMAIQSQVFREDRGEYHARIGEVRFRPLEVRAMRRRLRLWRAEVQSHREELSRDAIPFLDLAYEDLFREGMSLQERRAALDDVFAFLGYDPSVPGVDRAGIDALIDPARAKVNSPDTYRLVPGIEELERRFGSPENGWLFR